MTNWPTWAVAGALALGLLNFVVFVVASAQEGVSLFGVIATASLGIFAALAAQELRRRRALGR